ncbi:hypothetical protein CYMTET_54274, partial [Cymbomonas tetramitiformis]
MTRVRFFVAVCFGTFHGVSDARFSVREESIVASKTAPREEDAALSSMLYPHLWYKPSTNYEETYAESVGNLDSYAEFDTTLATVTVYSRGSDSYGPRHVEQHISPFVLTFTLVRNETCDDHYVALSKKETGVYNTFSAPSSIRVSWNCRFVMLFVDEEYVFDAAGNNCSAIPALHTMTVSVSSMHVSLIHENCDLRLTLSHGYGYGPFYLFVGADDDHAKGAQFTLINVTEADG